MGIFFFFNFSLGAVYRRMTRRRKTNFRPYIRRYTALNEKFKYSYPLYEIQGIPCYLKHRELVYLSTDPWFSPARQFDFQKHIPTPLPYSAHDNLLILRKVDNRHDVLLNVSADAKTSFDYITTSWGVQCSS